MVMKWRFSYQKETLALLILIVAAVALYTTFSPVKCSDLSCFEAHMTKCRPSSYINNEEDEAAWSYRILGTSHKKCDVEVTLLRAKDSGLELRDYEGQSMICSYQIGVASYPEKDLSSCTGQLKEGLQAIVIEKLYKYLVTNIGEIKTELSSY